MIRMTLVPGSARQCPALLGRSVCRLPSGLDRRMPNLAVEGAELQIERPEPVLH